MKELIHFLGQTIILLGLANIALLLVPRFIRKGIKSTIKTTYKVVKWTITLVIKQVKNNVVEEDKKKVAKRQYTKKSNKQPSNVVEFKKKATSK